MSEVQAGKLRKRLTLLAPPNPGQATADSFGQPQTTYADQGKLWGSVEALNGREYWQAMQAQVTLSHRVELRYSSAALTIAKDWRLSFEGRILNVQLPPRDVDGRRRLVELLCLEVAK